MSLRDGEEDSSVLEHSDSESDDKDMYDEKITPEEFEQIFGESDDEEFFEFWISDRGTKNCEVFNYGFNPVQVLIKQSLVFTILR